MLAGNKVVMETTDTLSLNWKWGYGYYPVGYGDYVMAYIGTAPSRSPLSSTQFDADLTLTDSLTRLVGLHQQLTIGDAGAEDTKLVFDGNAQDFYIGLDDGTDDLLIGLGSAVGTTPAIAIDENLDIVTSGVIKTTVAHDGGDTSNNN